MKKPLPSFIGMLFKQLEASQQVCRRCGIFLFLVVFSLSSIAQHFTVGNEKWRIEAGLNFGPTFFLGDLGGNTGKGTTFIKDLNLELTKMMKG